VSSLSLILSSSSSSVLSVLSKGRGLDGFYNLEEDLLTGKADTPGLMKLLQVRICRVWGVLVG
jgi:hypothetical protein